MQWQLNGLVGASAMALALATSVPVMASAQDSTIVGVKLSGDGRAGTPTNATATGSGLCGAVHIDWGDGTAITYATSTLPVTQSHVYQYGGTYTVRAQGMGNCAGQATTQAKIAGPPPPPPPPPPAPPAPPAPSAPRITGLELTPSTVAPKTATEIKIVGQGACRVKLDFGDGNSQELDGALPLTARHTYALAGKYAVVANPITACGGRHTALLVVGAAVAPRVDRVTINLDRSAGPGVREIRVEGAGRCAYTLDYGDGNSEGRNADLPEVVRHNYPAEGRYTVVVSPAAPCAGGSRATFVVRTRQ